MDSSPYEPIHISPSRPVRADELATLFTYDGPFATIYLPAPSDSFEAEDRVEIHLKNALRELDAHGLGAPFKTNLVETVASLKHSDGSTIVVISTAAGTALAGHLAEPLEFLAEVDAVPNIIPILDSTQRTVPHVIVLTDRAGADVFAVGTDAASTVHHVEGETEHIHRGHPGGWSQRRFQQRAENTWEANAKLVAHEVEQLAEEIDAQLVVAAGDVRAIGFLEEALPIAVRKRFVEVEGSREGDFETTAARVADVVASHVAKKIAQELADLSDRIGAGHAVANIDGVIAALRRGAVRTLYVRSGQLDDRRLAFSTEDQLLLAVAAHDLDGVAHSSVVEGSLRSVCIRAAFNQGAKVIAVPNSPAFEDAPVAATLRFPLDHD